MNVQYALKDEVLYVLEANPRASRTVPFVAKATGVPLAKAAARVMLGATIAGLRREGLLPAGGRRRPPARRAPDRGQGGGAAVQPLPHPDGRGVDSLLGPEMKSTGEVMGIDVAFGDGVREGAGRRVRAAADVRAWSSCRSPTATSGRMIFPVKRLADLGFEILATAGTASVLRAQRHRRARWCASTSRAPGQRSSTRIHGRRGRPDHQHPGRPRRAARRRLRDPRGGPRPSASRASRRCRGRPPPCRRSRPLIRGDIGGDARCRCCTSGWPRPGPRAGRAGWAGPARAPPARARSRPGWRRRWPATGRCASGSTRTRACWRAGATRTTPPGWSASGATPVAALAGHVAVVKPQVALFEVHGSGGVRALERVLADARDAGLLDVADAKRGDIGSTMTAYAAAWLADTSPLAADAVTLSPYLGVGSLTPAFDLAASTGRGVFVLARTSNPEAPAVQSAQAWTRDPSAGPGTGGHRRMREVAQSVVDACAAVNARHPGVVGVVVGATGRTTTGRDHGLDLSRLGGAGARARARRAGRHARRPRGLLRDGPGPVIPSSSREILAAPRPGSAARRVRGAERRAVRPAPPGRTGRRMTPDARRTGPSNGGPRAGSRRRSGVRRTGPPGGATTFTRRTPADCVRAPQTVRSPATRSRPADRVGRDRLGDLRIAPTPPTRLNRRRPWHFPS